MSTNPSPATKRHKWALNFNSRTKAERSLDILASPPGFIPSVNLAQVESSRKDDASLVAKRSWEVALAPLKQLPMNLFIMYMAGNSISIFPIMMVGMLILRPVKAFFTLGSTFKLIEGDQAILQKLVYLIGNVLGVFLALYKCQSMGLLPTHASDWLDFVEPPERLEFVGGGVLM